MTERGTIMEDLVRMKTKEERRRDIEKEIVANLQMEQKIDLEAAIKIRDLQRKREALYQEWKKLGGKVE